MLQSAETCEATSGHC